MKSYSFYFEVFSILLLLMVGCLLLALQLPGHSLIVVAGLLALLCISLRVKALKPALAVDSRGQ